MKQLLVLAFSILSFSCIAQRYQYMPQAGYGPVKRFEIARDGVLTLPIGIEALRNLVDGRDSGQIRYNASDSTVYIYTGSQWLKAVRVSAGGSTTLQQAYDNGNIADKNNTYDGNEFSQSDSNLSKKIIYADSTIIKSAVTSIQDDSHQHLMDFNSGTTFTHQDIQPFDDLVQALGSNTQRYSNVYSGSLFLYSLNNISGVPLGIDTTNGEVGFISGGGSSGGLNLYNSDSSLSSDRYVTMADKKITFSGDNDTKFQIDPYNKYTELSTEDGNDAFITNPNGGEYAKVMANGQAVLINDGTNTLINPYSGQNVGIGTNTPIFPLTIHGIAYSDDVISGANGIETSGYIYFYESKFQREDDTTNLLINMKGGTYHDTTVFIQNKTDGRDTVAFLRDLSNVSNWLIDGDNLYNKNTGNVGIGTNTPTNKLSILGTADISDSLAIGVASPTEKLHVKDGNIKIENGGLILPTYPSIDVTGGDYTATTAGIYEIVGSDGIGSFILPSALALNGQTITVINNAGENVPVSGGTFVTSLSTPSVTIYSAINGSWYGK